MLKEGVAVNSSLMPKGVEHWRCQATGIEVDHGEQFVDAERR